MSTEAISAYSPDTVYGQLTSPFTPKQITINAHTPYDKVDENESKVYSRAYFKGKPQAKMIYELPESDNKYDASKYAPKTDSESDTKTTTTLEVSSFQASSVSSKDIVQSSLKRGYSTTEAVAVTKAQNAYKNSAILTNDPTGVLSTCAYKVS